MSYRVRTEQRPCREGLDGTFYILESGDGDHRAEIWPALGFNCLSWQVTLDSRRTELLWADPNVLKDARPSRSGNPILFPFPNRIRHGGFRWDGVAYQLPITDPLNKNAIHGFAFNHPWRVIDSGADAASAWVRGEFSVSRDAPECRKLWPADAALAIRYILADSSLRLELQVRNPDRKPLPFGVGFHPYFRMAPDVASVQVIGTAAQAMEQWELVDCVPTRRRLLLQGKHDLLRHPVLERGLKGEQFDDAYRLGPPAADGSGYRVTLLDPARGLKLHVESGPEFRDLVVFTPPHREAVCVEPYTCITDAINLQQQGMDAGLRVLPPGESRMGFVRFVCRATDQHGSDTDATMR